MPPETHPISGIWMRESQTQTCKALPCERNGTESSHTNTQTQMTFTGIILMQAWPRRPWSTKKFPLVYRPGWRLRSGCMTLVRLLSMVTEQFGYSAITDGVTTAGSTTVISAGDTAAWDPNQSVGLQIFGGSIPAGATIVTVNASNNVTISAPATQSATGVAVTTAMIEPMPLPWDPVFQQKWGAFIQALGARYGNNPNVAYITMGGPGRRREAYFCFTPYDMDYFINTLGGLPNWQQGVQWIIDQYGTYFPNTPFILAMADPIPTTDGDVTLDAVVAYGAAQYPGNHFGVMSCGLQYPTGPDPGSNGAQWIPYLSPTSTVGFCFYGPQGPYTDPVTGRFMLDLGLERGFNFGAHFIEVYALDCNLTILQPVLIAWGPILTTTPTPSKCSEQFDGDSNLFIDH